MPDISKKIKTIETLDEEDISPKEDDILKNTDDKIESEASQDEPPEDPVLRPTSTVDQVKEVFSPEVDDSPDIDLADINLAHVALPGFLTRGLKENGKEPLKSSPVKSVDVAEPHSKPVYKAPIEASKHKSFVSTDTPPIDTPPTDPDAIPRVLSYNRLESGFQDDTKRFAYSKFLVFIAIFFWLVIASALAYGFFDLGLSWRTLTPISLAGLTLFIIGPALLIGLTAYSFSQLARISRAANQLDRTAQAIMRPDETVAGKAEALSAIIKNQIDTVDARLEQAQLRMADMEGIIRVQSDTLDAMRVSIETSTHNITHTFQTERSEFESVTTDLDQKMQTFANMVSDHSNNLARISKLAGQQITEARISTEGTAAKMNSASELVRQNTLEATATLKSGHEDIEHLGEMILKRSQELDNVYKSHAKDLTNMIEQLRDEQENLGISLEARLAKMRDVSVSAKASADSLTIASESGRKTIVALAEAANITEDALRTRFTEMEKMVAFSNSRAENISQMAARRVQSSLALTRKEIARIEMDMQSLQDKLYTQLNDKITTSPLPSNAPVAPKVLPVEPRIQEPQKAIRQVPSQTENDETSKWVPLDTAATTTPKAPPKRKGLLRLRPVDNGINNLPDEAPHSSNQVTEIPNLKAPPLNIDRTIELDEFDIDLDLSTDFDTNLDYFEEALAIPESFQEEEEDLTLRDAGLPTGSYQKPMNDPISDEAKTASSLQTFKESSVASSTGNRDEPLRPSDGVLERITRTDHGASRNKSKWGLRKIFKAPDPVVTNTDVMAPSPIRAVEADKPVIKAEPQLSRSNQEQIIATLSGMGLSPGAIVDDGCIIEAANSRRSNGASAMSHTVSNRLKEPVMHLRGALELNPELKSDARAFTSQFQIRLEAVQNDREGIRTRLESESGRAFLLCDAALNG